MSPFVSSSSLPYDDKKNSLQIVDIRPQVTTGEGCFIKLISKRIGKIGSRELLMHQSFC